MEAAARGLSSAVRSDNVSDVDNALRLMFSIALHTASKSGALGSLRRMHELGGDRSDGSMSESWVEYNLYIDWWEALSTGGKLTSSRRVDNWPPRCGVGV